MGNDLAAANVNRTYQLGVELGEALDEMAIRERVTGPRLQISLEAHGHPFGAELDGDIDEPRFPRSR